VHEFVGDFANDWFEDIWWCEVVGRLGESDKDGCYSKLVVCEIPGDEVMKLRSLGGENGTYLTMNE
jgi:hypothetical protein